MNSKISSYASVVIPILLGAGLTYFQYASFTPEQIVQMKSYFLTANYNYVLISLLIAISGCVFRAYRWKYSLQEIGAKSEFKMNFLAVCIGYFVNLTIPRSGEVSRALLLKKYRDVPFDKAFGTIIAERIVDLLFLVLFVLTALLLEFDTLKNFLLTYIPVTKLAWLIVFGIGFFIWFILLYRYSKWKYVLLFKSKIEGLKEGVLSIVHMPNKWKFIFFTLLIWLSYVFMFYITVFALPATSHISLGTIMVAFVIGGLTMSFTNGGFGFFPVLIAKILFLYNIPLEAGNAFGWIIWTSQLLITVLLGIFSFSILPMVGKRK
ncbi:lysylphosphatidylglycerol synthase transmembrane domain-containing protein [Flavobacterium luminosum]|uniref:Flippase-like domain-containing protein n=1 Tax=Flavobacterium luminosum TaxID=2949086 RepID=A0ABT0TRU6_9FLAO|nr:lysylphosphatidylglycerol synthase transmembrane domain-containing protein [Flavobacterium sp. HXWNR70]MCL9809608.1 flippase-like domain-containing protein [Flavobacterium sp. HXWNR70]